MQCFRRLSSLAIVVALTACGGGTHNVPVVGADGQPTGAVVQQQDSPGLMGMFGAALAGNMVGNLFNGSRAGAAAPAHTAPSHTTVINRTVVNKTIVRPAPTPPQTTPPVVRTSPSVPAPKLRASNWGLASRGATRSFRGGRR